MKIEIKNRYSGSVLFAHEAEENSLKITLLMALKAGANLRGANLYGANLYGANLYGANLYGADLSDANLSGAKLSDANLYGADLSGATLYGANLRGADLSDANLRGADLYGADLYGATLYGATLSGAHLRGATLSGAHLRGATLYGKKLVSSCPFFQCGPIGSRADYLQAFITDGGVMLITGCFHGTVTEFEEKLASTHEMNDHAIEYYAALKMIEVHAEVWAPKEKE